MRLPRVRFTVRRVMSVAVVVLLVIGIGAEVVRRRSRFLLERVRQHSAERIRLSADRDSRQRQAAADPAMRPVFLFDAERHDRAIAWHARQEDENRRAMLRPWEPVPPTRAGPPWPPIPSELYSVSRPDPPTGVDQPRASLVDAFLFQPWRYPLGDWANDPAIEDVWFAAPDGVRLNGWFAEARRPRAVVLYAEGNAGNMTGRRWVLRLFRDRLGCSVLVFDYRGYGRSQGSPSIAGVLEDARVARHWLAERVGLAEKDAVLVGNSLGGAVAVDLAGRDGARGLVLENTFSSLADVTEWHLGRLARLFVADRLDSASRIRDYSGPLLQTHGDADRVIPYVSGRRLFEAAAGPKLFVGVPGGDHNDPPAQVYLNALDRFLGTLPK
jgi:fermentation-respiration switch protein FrsA (DUF1100 family)